MVEGNEHLLNTEHMSETELGPFRSQAANVILPAGPPKVIYAFQ